MEGMVHWQYFCNAKVADFGKMFIQQYSIWYINLSTQNVQQLLKIKYNIKFYYSLLSRRTVTWRVKLVTLHAKRNVAKSQRRRQESTTSMNPVSWREVTFSREMPRFGWLTCPRDFRRDRSQWSRARRGNWRRKLSGSLNTPLSSLQSQNRWVSGGCASTD